MRPSEESQNLLSRILHASAVVCAVLMAGCGGAVGTSGPATPAGASTGGPAGPPTAALEDARSVDAAGVAAAATVANQIPGTAQLSFEWSLREPNLNVKGEGVVRVQPPDRVRLDLFLGEGSSVLAVALVGDDLRVPRGAPRGVIPSAPLLWASFGVFRPGPSSVVLGAEEDGDRIRIRYRLPDQSEIHYLLSEDRVVGVKMIIDGDLVHEIDLEVPDLTQLPRASTYRNHPSFRELKISVSEVEEMAGFPERIWSPGR